jgi:hypothetical protein
MTIPIQDMEIVGVTNVVHDGFRDIEFFPFGRFGRGKSRGRYKAEKSSEKKESDGAEMCCFQSRSFAFLKFGAKIHILNKLTNNN